jgi:nucleoside-diphosphate-sugar epimerase
MRSTLITGGAGFIGYHLARRLLADGGAVTLVDNFGRGVFDTDFRTLAAHTACTVIDVDLLAGALPPLGVDAVVHLAAIVGVQNVVSRPSDVLTKNMAMLERVLEYAQANQQVEHVLFASTSEVYAESVRTGAAVVPTSEDAPLQVGDLREPRSTYMLSKIYGEALCLQSGLPVTIVRPHNIYGPRMGMSHVIPELIRRAWETPEGGTLPVASPGHTRTFCYIDHATLALATLLNLPPTLSAVNLGRQSPEITIRELAEMVIDVVGRDLTVEALPDTPGSPERRCPDTTRLTSLTGLVFDEPLVNGIRRTFDWYRRNILEGVESSAQ